MLIFLAASIFFVLAAFFVADRYALGRTYVTPLTIAIFFLLLQHVSTFVYAIKGDYLDSFVFAHIAPEFVTSDSLIYIYVIYLLTAILSCSAVALGYYGKSGVLHKLVSHVLLFDRDLSDKKSFLYGRVLFFCGVLTYLYFVNSIGGLSSLWQKLYMRTQITAGTGYLALAYRSLCIIGFFLMYRYLVKRSKVILLLFVVVLIFILASLGQRGPAIAFIFSIFVYHSYRVNSIAKILSVRNFAIAAFCFLIMISMAQFRKPGFVEEFLVRPAVIFDNITESIMNHFVLRMGRLERDLVYIEHFSKDEYWLGASYLSLVLAPVPSGVMSDKPPLDTGVYIYNIANGHNVAPPAPTKSMYPTSWPEDNWAGYSNFGLAGLFTFVFISSWFFGFIGKLVITNSFKVFPCVFFSLISFGGVPSLSPYGIYQLLSIVFPLFFVALIGFFRFSPVVYR